MVVTLHHDQHVAPQVLVRDVPGIFRSIIAAADAQSLTLAERVVHEAAMLADLAALGGFDLARLRRQIAREEFGERPLADETDASAVLLVEHRERELARH